MLYGKVVVYEEKKNTINKDAVRCLVSLMNAINGNENIDHKTVINQLEGYGEGHYKYEGGYYGGNYKYNGKHGPSKDENSDYFKAQLGYSGGISGLNQFFTNNLGKKIGDAIRMSDQQFSLTNFGQSKMNGNGIYGVDLYEARQMTNSIGSRDIDLAADVLIMSQNTSLAKQPEY